MSKQAIIARKSETSSVKEKTKPGSLITAGMDASRLLARKDKTSLAHTLIDEVVLRTLGSDYNERIKVLKRETNDFGVDPWGVDPDYIRNIALVAALLHRYYFRVEVTGIENIPRGRVLIISNHSGLIPFDGAMIGASMLLKGNPPRVPRIMVEKWAAKLPYVSILFSRTGCVTGMPENARRLLEHEHPLLVFPEGAPGSNKLFSNAYQLEEFGLGFMRLALETETPIVPVSVIGAEEQYPTVYNFKKLARLIGAPAVPITPLMAIPILGMLPLPTKYRISFGTPLEFSGDHDDDDAVIGEKVWLVRSTIQNMVNRGLRDRKNVFW